MAELPEIEWKRCPNCQPESGPMKTPRSKINKTLPCEKCDGTGQVPVNPRHFEKREEVG